MTDEPKVWISSRKLKSGKRSYHLRWIDPVTRKWRNKAVGTDRKRAEREAAMLDDKLRQGTFADTRHVHWSEFTTEYVSGIRGAVNRAETERTLRMFAGCVNPLGPHRVTYAGLKAFVASLYAKGNSTSTVNKRVRYIRVAFNHAVKCCYLGRSPMAGWKWEREEQKIPRVLTPDEKAKLLDACPTEQCRTFVIVALTTGCRRNELLYLTWDRVDFENAQLVIISTKAKQDRLQPLNTEASAKLRRLQASTLKDGGPFVGLGAPSTVSERFRDIVNAANIERCTVHTLRRTFCTDLARLGVNQLVCQKLAGHASSATTAKFYQHIDDGTKRDAVAKLGVSA